MKGNVHWSFFKNIINRNSDSKILHDHCTASTHMRSTVKEIMVTMAGTELFSLP
jgi:hypothetical protein